MNCSEVIAELRAQASVKYKEKCSSDGNPGAI